MDYSTTGPFASCKRPVVLSVIVDAFTLNVFIVRIKQSIAYLRKWTGIEVMLATTPEEKIRVVKDAYITDIIPGIRISYEKTHQIPESFILAHCAILSLSGFYAGSKDTNGTTYQAFIKDFFPKYYDPAKLWKDIRNGLIHAYTYTSTYILAHGHPESHTLTLSGIKSERDGLKYNLTIINFEDFLEELEQAAALYFLKTENEVAIKEKLCRRYDIALPFIYVPDRLIPTESPLGVIKKLRQKAGPLA
jgi:hypothetical protein